MVEYCYLMAWRNLDQNRWVFFVRNRGMGVQKYKSDLTEESISLVEQLENYWEWKRWSNRTINIQEKGTLAI